MKEITGDLFQLMNMPDVDAICIATNGVITASQENVMGAGTAGIAADLWPGIKKNVARAIKLGGNVPMPIGILTDKGEFIDPPDYLPARDTCKLTVFSYPTKNHYKDKSDIELIKQSAEKLKLYADALYLKKILLCEPGTGKHTGQLLWEDVKKIIEPILDDRFFVIHYQEKDKDDEKYDYYPMPELCSQCRLWIMDYSFSCQCFPKTPWKVGDGDELHIAWKKKRENKE